MQKRLTRREFLLLSGSATIATALPVAAFSTQAAVAGVPAIAVQLYTIRDEIARDMPGAFHRLASLGVKTVETAFWPKGVSVAQAGQALKAAGLSVCSSHVEIPIGDKRAAMLENSACCALTSSGR